jgi:mxaJ protein
MGVRKGDEKLLEELDAALGKAEPQIHAILEEEGIPLLKPTPSNVTPKS